MKLTELLKHWETSAAGPLTTQAYAVRLPYRDAAKIAALAEMFPQRTEEQILSEILSAALAELEESMPYVPGEQVSAEDEQGDPIYPDVGPGPRFQALTRKHLERLKREG